MALNQGNLGNITVIQAGQTSAVYTVGSAQTAYVRSLLFHSLDSTNTLNASVHVVPNSGGSAGTAATGNRIARLGISTEDTYFFECIYPITLTANGDTIQVQNEGETAAITVLVLGDREA